MTITIIFESHSTTFDNENHISSGHYDVDLSPLGLQQSVELGQRHRDTQLAAVYCSDLQRSYKTAEIAFAERDITIVRDARLRECDYGDFTQGPSDTVSAEKTHRLTVPFPNGESYTDCAVRMKAFLDDVKRKHKDGDTVMVIGHRATQYGLNHCILGHSIEKCVTDPWKWQPGWTYKL